MEIRDYGLLGFHFMISTAKNNETAILFENFKLGYITKNHTAAIDHTEYDALIAKGDFSETLTAYFVTDDDFSFSITHSEGYIEVWFGFYPGNDISGYKKLLADLNALADFCIAGFEVEIETDIIDEVAEGISPSFYPFCLLKNGEIKWCGKDVSPKMEVLIEENLKMAELIL